MTRITVELTMRRYHDDGEDLSPIVKGVAEPVGRAAFREGLDGLPIS
jgi:hypothetical protein